MGWGCAGIAQPSPEPRFLAWGERHALSNCPQTTPEQLTLCFSQPHRYLATRESPQSHEMASVAAAGQTHMSSAQHIAPHPHLEDYHYNGVH